MSIETVVGRLWDVDSDGTDTTGTVHNNAWLQSLQDKVDAVVGDWVAITFAAGNFTGNGSMTWTLAAGDVLINRYMRLNKSIFWQCVLATTTVGGTPNTTLQIACPLGTFANTVAEEAVAYCNDAGTLRDALLRPVSTSVLGIRLSAGGNWAASTNITYISFKAHLELA